MFEGDFDDEDIINYAKTISDKMCNNADVIRQIENNSRGQAMIGGFQNALDDAVIDSLDLHQNFAKQVLSEDKVKKGLANVVYDLIVQVLKDKTLMSNLER